MNEWEEAYAGSACPCGQPAEFVELASDDGRTYRVTPGTRMGNKSYREDAVQRIRCRDHKDIPAMGFVRQADGSYALPAT